MSAGTTNPNDVKMLPPGDTGQGLSAGASAAVPLPPSSPGGVTIVQPATPSVPLAPASPVTSITAPRQLADLPKDELDALAEEFGLEPRKYKSPQELVAAIHDRRQLIASLDREAMLDVIRWGRRPVPINASKEQIAFEILKTRSMRFEGLSERGLAVLARLRGVELSPGDTVPLMVKKIKKGEGFFARLNRKRRAMLGAIVAKMMGEDGSSSEYQFLPPQHEGGPATTVGTTATAAAGPASAAARDRSIKEEIEESGLFGGIAARVKKTADSYINQKLDEIEARIDRKLDEIDRRLAEWRDKEIANRIRILKITLWASVIVAALSLVYSYIRVYFTPKSGPSQNPPANVSGGGSSSSSSSR
jgi:hypothetical protein